MIKTAQDTSQIQEPVMGGNEEISEAVSENKRSDETDRYALQLCCSSSQDVTDLFDKARSTASFHLEVSETASKDLARKIKYEAKNHCAKIKEIALDEIINNKLCSSKVLKECSQMMTETLHCMEEQLNKLMDCKKMNVSQIKNYVLKEVSDTMKESLEPGQEACFEPKTVGALASLCRKSVMTLHVFLESFVVFGTCVYACKRAILPFYA